MFYSYSGNQTTITDEVGSQRRTQTDALGRLTNVWEAPNTSGYNWPTTYQYDALNDLTGVTQNGSNSSNARVRSFVYDSLARLSSATNPESGTLTYTYDANSNVITRVEPKANTPGSTALTTSTYTYDALNRLLSKVHADPISANSYYGYDGTAIPYCPGPVPPTITSPTNLVGRRSAMCANQSASNWSYDQMGRPLVEARTNVGPPIDKLNVSYTYYKDGSLNTLTYPSGDLLTYIVGGAGRPLSARDSTNNYVTAATYAPHGALTGMTNGTGIVTTNIYSDRLQPIQLLASVSTTSIFSLCYDFHLRVAVSTSQCAFGASTIGDNGNVFQILNKVDPTRSSAFIYDPLNRIAQAYTVNTSSPNCWGETYSPTATAAGVLPSTPGIDAWGNLTNRSGVSGMAGNCTYKGLSATATTQNQLGGIGIVYDPAGNVVNDGLGNTPTYDAENRIVTDAGLTYSYDADGVRINKSSGTMYWPGPGGEILTEATLAGVINEEYVFFNGQRIARVDRPSGAANYYFSDNLGSASVIVGGPLETVQAQYFYYPYGWTQSSTGSDPNHYKFTGKERDAESGLDYFGARYMASTMGRFMTPDPVGGHQEDPQTLNRYAYVRNNPLSLTDPTGLDFYMQCGSSDHKGCTQVQTDPNNSKSTQWVQAGADGKATIITSDSIRAGQNTATMSENGLQVNGSQGIYFDNAASHSTDANGNDVNHNSLDLAGGGDLKGFNFHVDGNCGGTCLSSGEWSAPGMTSAQAREALSSNSFHIPFENFRAGLGFGDHPYSTQFRFGGTTFGCASSPCPNTPHLSVPFDPAGSFPKYSVPAAGGWHVDAHSGWSAHNQDINDTH
jgi:RHS repeat-associated protein